MGKSLFGLLLLIVDHQVLRCLVIEVGQQQDRSDHASQNRQPKHHPQPRNVVNLLAVPQRQPHQRRRQLPDCDEQLIVGPNFPGDLISRHLLVVEGDNRGVHPDADSAQNAASQEDVDTLDWE